MLAKFIEKLAKEMEMKESFETEVPGVYGIPFEEGISILISTRPRGFSISCTFGDTPKGEKEEFYTQCMKANLLGKGTNGAILGLDTEAKRLKLTRDIDYTIDYYEFRDMIEDFMNSIDFWTEEAQSYVSEEV